MTKTNNAVVLSILFLVSIFGPVWGAGLVSGSASQNQYPTAYLPDWNLTSYNPTASYAHEYSDDYFPYDIVDASQQVYLPYSTKDSTFGIDNLGNQYYAYAGGGTMGSTGNGYGVHFHKINSNGSEVWSKTVSSTSYCYSDDYRCSVIALHVLGEDEFFTVLSVYNTGTVSFSNTVSVSTSSHQLIIAYHSANGWQWAEAQSSPNGYASRELVDQRMDESGNLYLTLDKGTSGSYRQFSVMAYTSMGGQWTRLLELGSSSYSGDNMAFDAEFAGLHFLVYTYNSVRYDSQTTQCPGVSSGTNTHCFVWLSLNPAGQKTSAVAVVDPSAMVSNFEVIGNIAHVSTLSFSMDSNQNTYVNFSGQETSCSQMNYYCSHIVKLGSNGTWYDAEEFSLSGDDDTLIFDRAIFEDDGSGVLFLYSYGSSNNPYFDGQALKSYSTQFEFIVVGFDAAYNYKWKQSFAVTDDVDCVSFKVTSAGYAVFSGCTSSTSTSWQMSGAAASPHTFMAWISTQNGTIFDIELDTYDQPLDTLPNGGLVAYDPVQNKLQFYVPDNDNDNIGASDNCPEVYNPSQSDYDDDSFGDSCDEDDDADGISDVVDLCPRGDKGWISTSITDHDNDGCRDISLEDADDDNDGYSDLNDACPTGIVGAANDYDGDGCKNSEDSDDDNDGILDGSDLCTPGNLDWSSGTVTDHDSDGCEDNGEDADDDNDGVVDQADSCSKGETNWPSNANTDFDGDGCKDGYEDEDDDGDGVLNFEDQCEDSIGSVNEEGCTIGQNGSGGNSGGESDQTTVIYYVCPQGGAVVTDLTDCPEQVNSTENQSSPEIFYVCPGGSAVVSDLADCPVEENTDQQNITYVLNPDSNLSDEFSICPGGTAIVMNLGDCPGPTENQQNSGGDDAASVGSSQDSMTLIFAGGAFLMAMGAVVVVLFRRPTYSPEAMYQPIDSSNQMFKEQPQFPTDLEHQRPPVNAIGVLRDGYEWVEWPEESGTHWYRSEGSSTYWSKYT